MSAQPDVNQAAADYRARLLAADQRALRLLAAHYRDAAHRLEADLRKVTARIAEARLAGEDVNASWLFQQARFRTLLERIDAELRTASTAARDVIVDRIVSETHQAVVEAHALAGSPSHVQAVGGPLGTPAWTSLPTSAVEQIIGAAHGPLGALLAQANRDGAAAAKHALVRGVTLGWNPRKTQHEVRRALAIPAQRALLIARTETLRAYREASRHSWASNPRLVKAWRWVSASDSRCCPVCWSQDGQAFPLDQVMATHPACRCSMTPVTVTFDELGLGPGLDDTAAGPGPTGIERFARLAANDQDVILGKAKGAAYRDGRIDLPDVVESYHHPVWGPSRRVVSLADAEGRARG